MLIEEDMKSRSKKDVAHTKHDIHEFQGIRITPSSLIFRDVMEADILTLKFTLHNISDVPKKVRILEPRSLGFKLCKVSREKMLSPGMLIEKAVKFFNMRNWGYLLTSAIPIRVDEDIWDLPILVEQAMPLLFIEPPEIDFETVDVGTRPMTRTFKVMNKGPIPTKFAFDLGNNELDLTVQPMKGELMGKSSMQVRVQVVPIYPGAQFTEFWLRGYRRPIRVPVMLTANVPRLEIYHPNKTWNFTLIDFPPTYFGTCCNETLALQNVSANVGYYVVLGEVNNKTCARNFLMDFGWDPPSTLRKVGSYNCLQTSLTAEGPNMSPLHLRVLGPVLQEAARGCPAFNVFRMMPDEGSLKPFEGRISSVEFRPKECYMKQQPWKHKLDKSKEIDFLVFVVMLRVQSLTGTQLEKAIENHMKCIKPPRTVIEEGGENAEEFGSPDVLLEESSSSEVSQTESTIPTVPKMQTKIVIPTIRLCLHGIAIFPQVEFLPTEFSLDNMTVGITEQRVLRITNKNNLLPINFSYKKMSSVDMAPPSGMLEPLQSLEVSISFRTQTAGTTEKLVKIEILGKSHPFADKPQLVRIGCKKFLVKLFTASKTSMPKPKFNMGITPQITNEVGVSTDQVTFDSQQTPKPQAAMLKADLSRKRNWFPRRTRKIAKKLDPINESGSPPPSEGTFASSKESLCVKSTDEDPDLNSRPTEGGREHESLPSMQATNGNVVLEKSSEEIGTQDMPQMKEKGRKEETAAATMSLRDMFPSQQEVLASCSKESVGPTSGNRSTLTIFAEEGKSQNTPGSAESSELRKMTSEFIIRPHSATSQEDSVEDLSVGRLGLPQKYFSSQSNIESLSSYIISEETGNDQTKTTGSKTRKQDSSSSIDNLNSGGSRKQLSFLVDLHVGEMIPPASGVKKGKRVDGKKSSMSDKSKKLFTQKLAFKVKEQQDGSEDNSSKNTSVSLEQSESALKVGRTSKTQENKLPHSETKLDRKAPLRGSSSRAAEATAKLMVDNILNKTEDMLHMRVDGRRKEARATSFSLGDTKTMILDDRLHKQQVVERKEARSTSFSLGDTKTIILHDSATDIPKIKLKPSQSILSTTSLRRKSNASYTRSARKLLVEDYVDEALEAAKLLLNSEKCEETEPKKEETVSAKVLTNDLIAFPNDVQRSLRRWAPDKRIRTIFTGKDRYSCPIDTEYARSTNEIAARTKNHLKYIQSMRQIATHLKEMKAIKTGKPRPLEEYVCSRKLDLQSLLKLPPMSTLKKMKSEASSLPLYPLTALQLYNIRVKPTSINFGKIPPKSNIIEFLSVENLNPFKIMFLILPGETGIKFPDGNRKILQPMSKTKLKMAYYEFTMGRHNGSMQFIINDNHSFEVTVYAEVISKNLQLAPNTLDFKNFSHDDMFQPSYLTVGIVNNLQCYTKFFWDVPTRSCYSIYPTSGSVPPLATLQVCVKNNRDVVKPLTLDIVMTTESGSKEKLHCTSHLRDGKYVGFLNRKLDLQELALNLPTEHFAMAYNGSYCTYMFKILNPEPMPGILVTPQSGLLKPRSVVTFLIHCQIKAVIKFEVKLQLQLEKTKIIELPIVGSVGYPNVILKPDQIKLRRMSADSFDSVKMTIKNRGTTLAKVKFLLHNHNEYFLSKSSDIYAPKDNCREEYSLDPGKNVTLYLHFIPYDVATYNFALPVIINDILGPVNLDNPETFTTQFYLKPKEDWFKGFIHEQKVPARLSYITIQCTVVNHVLAITKPRVFLSYPASASQDVKTSDTIRVTNQLKHPTTFLIDTHELKNSECPFRFVTTDKGTVTDDFLTYTFDHLQFENFHVYFRPKKPGKYVLKLPITISGYEGLYNNLYFEGIYKEPLLEVNAREIYFQPLPLEFESTTTIYLTASNYYCKSKITANIVPGQYDEKKVAEKLSVMFLSGYNIYPSDTPLVLPVKLIFKSQEPVSFKTQFCFSDTLGHNCYVTLIATADNCSLTTYAFLTQADAIQTPSEDSQTSSPESADGNVSMASSRQASRLTSLSDESEALDTRSFRVQVHRKLSKRSGPIEFSSMTLTGDSIVGSAIDSGQQEASQTEEEESDRNVHYPRFPAEDDDSYRAHFLNKTLQAVESWLYDEGFHCSFAPTIPEGISLVVSVVPSSDKPVINKQFVPKTILDLLDNLMGVQTRKLFVKGPIPDVNEERIAYFHKLYSHLIDFLSNNGGCLAHVKPCYLLSYNDYVVYMNRDVVDPKNPSIKLVPCDSCINIYGSKSSENSDMSHYFDKSTLKLSSYKEFMSYSKQYWLDLILQLHKVTVLSKITVDSIRFKKHDIYVNLEMGSSQLQISNTRMSLKETESNPENERKCNFEDDEKKDVRNKATNMYNQQESIILLWLEEKYKQQRITLSTSSQAMRPKGIPPLKEVTNFEADLSDGLVYAAVTAAYCPYLAKAFFNDLFLNPLSEEESFHNAIQVTKAWQAIKLGFTIAPEDIVYPNSVKMLLLSAYLYEILPSFTTKSVISFQSELSREEKKTLTLANPSQQKVTYGVIILGDPLGLFKIKNETVISVKKNSSSSLVLAYDARMVGSFQATLILCGNIAPPNFGRNLAFDLVAKASPLTVSEVFVLSPPLYKPHEESLKITPPYKQEAEYNIYITEEEPTTEDKLKMMLWQDVVALKSYRRLFIQEEKIIKREEDSTFLLNLKIYCLIPQSQNYWLVFRDTSVGDFIVKITINQKQASVLKKINLKIPEWNCQCSDIDATSLENTVGCPMRIELAIPCRNTLMWNAIYNMMDTIFDEQEKEFWHNYRETSIGLRLTHYLSENDSSTQYEELAGTYNKSVTYNVNCNKTGVIVCPEKFHIPDARNFNDTKLPVHLTPELHADTCVKLTLKSEDNTEVRIFEVSFTLPEDAKPQKKKFRGKFSKPSARR